MSLWYEAEIGDISVDKERGELDIYVTSDDMGAIYVTVKIDDVKTALSNPDSLREKE